MSGRGARQRRSRARQQAHTPVRTSTVQRVPFRIGFVEADQPPRWWHDRKVLPARTTDGRSTADLFTLLIDQIGPANARAQGWCV